MIRQFTSALQPLPLFALVVLTSATAAQDWPMYRSDYTRSGHTHNKLPDNLHLQWQHKPTQGPSPAWPRRERMEYDRAFQPVVAGDRLFYGSSSDGSVYALDTRTGRALWSFDTDAPVRFAPAVFEDLVFVVSDDGWLYCLSTEKGEVVWKKRGGPDGRRLLGNGYMISRWPARGGPVVHDGIVYFAAGLWQSEGIYIYALRARTGKKVWVNDDSGAIVMAQPHGGANAESGVSAQGHLVATESLLLVPTGRAVPAAFDLKTGKFEYYHLQRNGSTGGSATMASGKYFFNNGVFFDAKSGVKQGKTGATAIAGMPDGIVTVSRKGVIAYRWANATQKNKKGKKTQVRKLQPAFTVQRVIPDKTVIVAGDQIVAGGSGSVSTIGLREQRETWSAKVEGTVFGLVVAGGQLFASTDTGSIYCFGSGQKLHGIATPPRPNSSPYGKNNASAAAREILKRSGIKAGYCVDIGCGDGALTYELLRNSDLTIIAIDEDIAKVRIAREKLREAGLYGSRVMVHHGSHSATQYAHWFANLVVSGRSISAGPGVVSRSEAARLQRPHGGVVCIGKSGAMTKTVRGALPGEGTWTHQYADAANTVCSNDGVHGPLGVLWFADVGQQLTQRHGRGPAPLYLEGRVFSLGLHSLIAVDAYNGRVLWEYPFPNILKPFHGDHLMGTAGTNGMYCIGEHGIYVRDGGRCLRIDPATGEKLAEFAAPQPKDGSKATWGYIAAKGDLLFGSLADVGHIVTYRFQKGGDMKKLLTESRTLFALDAKTGELRWRYDAENSIRHNAITIGEKSIYLIDRSLAEIDQMTRAKKKAAKKNKTKLPVQRPGILLALDTKTGSKQWEKSDDIFGTVLALSVPHNALMMSYQPTRFRLDSEVGGRIAVFDRHSGKRLWQKKADYQSRPLINDKTIFAQGGAWDVRTGKERPFPFKRSYGCGILAAGKRTLVYRSATLGYYDLKSQSGNEDFGGIRPGCWINAIPAGGMVLVPDGSAGCRCSYQNKTWLALRPIDLPKKERKTRRKK